MDRAPRIQKNAATRGEASSNPKAALRITLQYALFAGAWILFSDQVLLLFPSSRAMVIISTLKGWIFVLVTAILLYSLVSDELARRAALEAELKRRIAEQSALLHEVHHRVRNNLQVMTSLQTLLAEELEAGEARAAFEASRAAIRAMSLALDRSYEAGAYAGVDLSAYLAELARDAAAHFGAQEPPRLELAPAVADLDAAILAGVLVAGTIAEAAQAPNQARISLSLEIPGGAEALLHIRAAGGKSAHFRIFRALAGGPGGAIAFRDLSDTWEGEVHITATPALAAPGQARPNQP